MSLLKGSGSRSMSKYSLKDIFVLAGRRKDAGGRIIFVLQGIVFLPFLKFEEIRMRKKDDVDASSSSSGDDVYPLF